MRDAVKLALVLIVVTALIRFVAPKLPVIGPHVGGLV